MYRFSYGHAFGRVFPPVKGVVLFQGTVYKVLWSLWCPGVVPNLTRISQSTKNITPTLDCCFLALPAPLVAFWCGCRRPASQGLIKDVLFKVWCLGLDSTLKQVISGKSVVYGLAYLSI